MATATCTKMSEHLQHIMWLNRESQSYIFMTRLLSLAVFTCSAGISDLQCECHSVSWHMLLKMTMTSFREISSNKEEKCFLDKVITAIETHVHNHPVTSHIKIWWTRHMNHHLKQQLNLNQYCTDWLICIQSYKMVRIAKTVKQHYSVHLVYNVHSCSAVRVQ
jgi:hypothetical protein